MLTMRWVVPVLSLLFLLHPPAIGGEGRSPSRLDPTTARLSFFSGFPADTIAFQAYAPTGGSGKKSVGLAAFYSLLLPGMGELYAGGFGTGRYFLIAEGGLWLTYTGFQVYGDALRGDARAYAVQHAGVNASGKDDQFFVDVSNYLNINDYNQAKLQQRSPDKLYDPAAGYGWQWDSDASRATFKSQRILSENVYNDRKFVVAFIIVNHVASAIDAARAAIAHNKALENPLGDLQMSARLIGGFARPQGILMTFTKPL